MVASNSRKTAMLRRKQVEARTGLSRSTLYARINSGTFPPPIKLGDGDNPPVGWIESEIDDWLGAQIEKSRGGGLSISEASPSEPLLRATKGKSVCQVPVLRKEHRHRGGKKFIPALLSDEDEK